MSEKKALPNVKALKQFRMNGKVVVVGQVVAKSDFKQKSDWQNLAHMDKPRVEETADKVGLPTKSKKASAGGMPNG